jgi:hypothetical protein
MHENNTRKYHFSQKGGFVRNIQKSIQDITIQEELACALRVNDTLNIFIIDCLYKLFIKFRQVYNVKMEFDSQITQSITEVRESNANNIINNIGFSSDEILSLLKSFNNDYTKNRNGNIFKPTMVNLQKKKPHAVSTMFARLSQYKYVGLLIKNDSDLYSEFIDKLKKIYCLPDTFDKNDFDIMYAKTETSSDMAYKYGRMITLIMHTSLSLEMDNHATLGINQLNYNVENFNRNRVNNIVVSEIPHCFNDITENIDTDKIKGVESYYNFDNTFTKNIFEKYNRKLVGGPSGSIYSVFFIVCKILKMQNNKENLYKILCFAIMDYVPIWHSLEEILLTLSVEFTKIIPGLTKYTLDMDPLEYVKDVFKPTDYSISRTRRKTITRTKNK